MQDILQDFPIQASPSAVFQAIATPEGLDKWWTLRSSGVPAIGEEYELWFGPGYDWRARVVACAPDSAFALEMTRSGADWAGSRVAFRLSPRDGATWVQFTHSGWPNANEHFRISAHCWALYLRILRRWVERGETVPYEERLSV